MGEPLDPAHGGQAERLLTEVEAAAVIGVTKRQMYLWRWKDGGPDHVRPTPRRPMYVHSVLMEWAKGRSCRTNHEARGLDERGK